MIDLALSSNNLVTISLWVLGGIAVILLTLITVIVKSFNQRLGDVEDFFKEGNLMDNLKNKLQQQEIDNKTQDGKVEKLNLSIETLESSIRELKKDINLISTALSHQFQTKDTCDLRSSQLIGAIQRTEKQSNKANEETKETLKEIGLTLTKLNNIVIKLETQVNINGR